MPQKKPGPAQSSAGQAMPLLVEGADPVATAMGIVDKKARNLEKRKVRKDSLVCIPPSPTVSQLFNFIGHKCHVITGKG